MKIVERKKLLIALLLAIFASCTVVTLRIWQKKSKHRPTQQDDQGAGDRDKGGGGRTPSTPSPPLLSADEAELDNELRERYSRHWSMSKGSVFPKVYDAVVPCPGVETSGSATFQARVDFLELLETNVDRNPELCRISFLVHSEHGLESLRADEATTASQRTAGSPSGVFDLKVNPDRTVEVLDAAEAFGSDSERQKSVYSTIDGYNCYRDVDGMNAWMDDFVAQANAKSPSLTATKTTIGYSHLGEEMFALHLTGDDTVADKAPMFIMTGIHPREYAPPELAARWLEYLVDGYGTDAEITNVVDRTNIHVVLESNPDGRRVAETNRWAYQRKNRNEQECGSNGGVDLNRNFDFRWGLDDGSSSNPCDETYRGPSPNSENETRAIVDYVSDIFPVDQRHDDPEGNDYGTPYDEATTKGVFFDIHSFGELIIWPWAHGEYETLNDEGLETLANKFRAFNDYELAGPDTSGFLYPASGVTDDFAYGRFGATGMTLELGTAFYQGCSYFNNNVVSDNIPVLTYAAKVAGAPYSLPKGPDIPSEDLTVSMVGDDELAVTAKASEFVYHPPGSEYATDEQEIASIRVYIDEHPDDASDADGTEMDLDLSGSGGEATGSLTMDIASLSTGERHMIYAQATDTNGYKGPVTVAFFTIGGDDNGGDDDNSPPPTCADDSTETFYVTRIGQTKDCAWLAKNLERFDFLCSFLAVASICPLTCNKCETFGLRANSS